MDEYDFSPPTSEELKAVESEYDLSPPTEREKQKYLGQPKTSSPLGSIAETAQDFLTSAAQEGTAGFSDEGIAMARAILDSVRGKGDRQSLYEKYVSEERERVKLAQERSPTASFVGGLTGVAVPALLTSGAASVATKALPSAAKLLGTGALAGGISAIGKSEKNLDELTLKEALSGAAEGAVVAGALGATGKALGAGKQWLGQKLESSDLGRQALLARKLVKEGVDITSREFQTSSKKASTDITGKVYGALAGIGTDINQALVSAENQGMRILADGSNINSIEKGIKALDENRLFGSETPNFIKKFQSLFSKTDPLTGAVSKSGLSPVEANELRRELRDALADAIEKQKIDISDVENISELNRVLKDKLNLIPDFKKSNEFYEEFARKIPGAAGGKGFEEFAEFINPVTGELKKIKTGVPSFSDKTFLNVQKDIESLINKLYAGGVSKKDQVAAFELLEKNLKEMNPEVLKRYGITPNELLSTIKKEADISKIGTGIFGVESDESVQKHLTKYASPSGALFRAAGLVGETEKAIQKAAGAVPSVVKKPLEISNYIMGLPVVGLKTLGSKMAASQSKKISDFGNYLVKNSATDTNLKTKALFLLLQDPDLKDAIVPYLGEK